MNMRKTVLALAVASAALPAAYANNFVGGELGWDTSHSTNFTNSQITREQLQRDYQAFRDHPVLLDGTVMVQGQLGYVSGTQAAGFDKVPSRPHTHALGNVGAPVAKAAPMTEAERRAYAEQYRSF